MQFPPNDAPRVADDQEACQMMKALLEMWDDEVLLATTAAMVSTWHMASASICASSVPDRGRCRTLSISSADISSRDTPAVFLSGRPYETAERRGT